MTLLAFNENMRLSGRSRHWCVRVMLDVALHVADPAFAQLVTLFEHIKKRWKAVLIGKCHSSMYFPKREVSLQQMELFEAGYFKAVSVERSKNNYAKLRG